MPIRINGSRAATLSAAGTSNNPIAFWNNLGASGTWTTDLGTEVNSAAYAGTGTTFDQWTATTNGSGVAALEVDLGSAQTVAMLAIAAHNLADLGGTVQAGYGSNGITWTPIGNTVSPSDNEAIILWFQDTSARYWRAVFTGATAAANLSVGVMFVGEPLTIEQRIYQGYRPPITPTEVTLQSNVSEGGHLLGSSAVKKASTASAGLTHLDPATIRGNAWKSFQTHFNEGGGFFWAWRPTKYGDCHYAWREGAALAPTNSGPKEYMAANLEMRLYDEP